MQLVIQVLKQVDDQIYGKQFLQTHIQIMCFQKHIFMTWLKHVVSYLHFCVVLVMRCLADAVVNMLVEMIS